MVSGMFEHERGTNEVMVSRWAATGRACVMKRNHGRIACATHFVIQRMYRLVMQAALTMTSNKHRAVSIAGQADNEVAPQE